MGVEEVATTEEAQTPEMLPIAWQGYEDARKRHEQDAIRTGADPKRAYSSAVESVYWAALIDEQLRTWVDYEQVKRGVPGGQLLPGVRYARNLQTHQLPLTLRQTNGAIFPIRFPTVFREVVWHNADALPEPDKTNRHTAGQRAAFQQYMAGKPTRHTFDDVARFFRGLRDMPACPLAD